MNSIILKAATRILAGIVFMFAIYLLWRGHHEPGGGFIAALVASTGFALIAVSEGPGVVRRGLFVAPQDLIGAGIAVSITAGLLPMLKQQPFLTGVWWPVHDPVLGTPLLFDIGVFLVVLGAILTVLLSLEET